MPICLLLQKDLLHTPLSTDSLYIYTTYIYANIKASYVNESVRKFQNLEFKPQWSRMTVSTVPLFTTIV